MHTFSDITTSERVCTFPQSFLGGKMCVYGVTILQCCKRPPVSIPAPQALEQAERSSETHNMCMVEIHFHVHAHGRARNTKKCCLRFMTVGRCVRVFVMMAENSKRFAADVSKSPAKAVSIIFAVER